MSSVERTCPDCGAELPENADFCWVCRKQSGPAKADAGPPPTRLKGIPAFFATLGIVLVVFVAAGIAFFTTCLGGVWAGFAVGESTGRTGEESLGWGLLGGLLFGIVGAVTAAYLSIRFFARRARRRRAL
jgi:hypothetical protein